MLFYEYAKTYEFDLKITSHEIFMFEKFFNFSFVLSFFDGNIEMRARLVMFVKLLDRDFRVIWR